MIVSSRGAPCMSPNNYYNYYNTSSSILLLLLGAVSYCCARYGRGSGLIHMDDVRCIGNETSLTDCPHIMNHNCGHSEDASVRCQTSN